MKKPNRYRRQSQRSWLILNVGQKMKHAVFVIAVLIGLCGCAKKEESARATVPAVQVTLADLAALKTVAAVESFARGHSLPFSKQTLDVMRLQSEQIPSSALGTQGRVWLTVHLQNPETTAHLYFYHDQSGYVISTIVHLERVNKP